MAVVILFGRITCIRLGSGQKEVQAAALDWAPAKRGGDETAFSGSRERPHMIPEHSDAAAGSSSASWHQGLFSGRCATARSVEARGAASGHSAARPDTTPHRHPRPDAGRRPCSILPPPSPAVRLTAKAGSMELRGGEPTKRLAWASRWLLDLILSLRNKLFACVNLAS
jgi:hypothetical protein